MRNARNVISVDLVAEHPCRSTQPIHRYVSRERCDVRKSALVEAAQNTFIV